MDDPLPSSTRARAAGWLVVAVLMALIGRAVYASFYEVDYYPQSDDGYYLRYMGAVAEHGPRAFPGLFADYLGDQRQWNFPPPNRVGFALVSALWSKLFGVSMEALSALSLAAHLALIAVTYAFARRWFGAHQSVLAAALVAFSPLYLGFSRLALTDSFISLSQCATIWLFLEYVRAPQRLGRGLLFAASFAFAILTKEIAVLLAIPLVAYAAVERWGAKRDVPILRTALLLSLPLAVVGVVWILAAGSLGTLYEVLRIVLLSPSANKYAIAFGSGGWFRYPIDELLMSPWPTLLGLAGAAVALWRWRSGDYRSLSIALTLVYACQVGVLSFFTKNLRYVAVLETPLRVLAVVLLWDLCGAQRKQLGRAFCTLLVAALCWLGWSDYELVWRQSPTYDPRTVDLSRVRGLIPAEPESE